MLSLRVCILFTTTTTTSFSSRIIGSRKSRSTRFVYLFLIVFACRQSLKKKRYRRFIKRFYLWLEWNLSETGWIHVLAFAAKIMKVVYIQKYILFLKRTDFLDLEHCIRFSLLFKLFKFRRKYIKICTTLKFDVC